MRLGCWRSVLVVAGLAVLTSPASLAGRKEERARREAYEEALASFGKLFRSEDPVVRAKGVKKLVPFADLGAGRVVVEKVLGKEKNPSVLDAAVGVIASTKDAELIDWLAGKATGRADWRLRTTIVEALGYVNTPRAAAALVKILRKEKDPRVLTMALFGVAEKKLLESVDDVLRHLEHEDWQVRVASIEALTALKLEKTVPALIDRLMNERGRLREDLADALRKITGKKLGRDANAWRRWLHEGDEVPDDPAAGGAGGEKGPATSKVREPTYFGIKVVSDRVLFVLDVSLSMKTPIDIDKMKLAREAAITGGDEKEREDRDKEEFENTINWWEIKDRLDLAKAQLKFVIKNLGEKQQFEIVTFSENVSPYNDGRLMKATRRAKIKAVQFVDTLDVEGATAAGAALDFAYEMAGPGMEDKNYRAGVDTLFFLSDGAPTDRSAEEILAELRQRNRLRKIKINVVAIVNHSVRFLRLLAEQNGGVYKFFKVEDKR